jgi:hypothetical protein
LLFENLKLLSACKPKLRVISIALKVKQFLGSNEQPLKKKGADFDFSTLIAIIIWIIDDAEHGYETTTVIKLKGIYDYFLEFIHCTMHKTEGSM